MMPTKPKFSSTLNTTTRTHLVALNYKLTELQPVMTKQNVDWHYNVHTRNYVEAANKQKDNFNVAGAFLHNMWWEQFKAPKQSNTISQQFLKLVKLTEQQLKKLVLEQALSIKGSGWVAIDKTGQVITIETHKKINNLVFVLDMWEHSYYPTYGPDKKLYVESIWKIIDWDIIDSRF